MEREAGTEARTENKPQKRTTHEERDCRLRNCHWVMIGPSNQTSQNRQPELRIIALIERHVKVWRFQIHDAQRIELRDTPSGAKPFAKRAVFPRMTRSTTWSAGPSGCARLAHRPGKCSGFACLSCGVRLARANNFVIRRSNRAPHFSSFWTLYKSTVFCYLIRLLSVSQRSALC